MTTARTHASWALGTAILAAIGLAAQLLVPQPASAAVSCSYDAPTHTLTVTADANGDVVALRVESGGGNDDVEVFEGVPEFGGTEITPCGPDQPTINDTDTVELNESAAGTSSVTFRLALANGAFAPGFTDEGQSNEIEFDVTADDDGSDQLQVIGGPGDENIRFGMAGGVVSANLNGGEIGGTDAGDRDLDAPGIDSLLAQVQGGHDTVTADGAAGAPDFDGPVPLRVTFLGGPGNDTLRSGTFGVVGTANSLEGDAGDDTMIGSSGTDSIHVGEGNDTADGGGEPGPGLAADFASYLNHNQPVTVDLRVTAQQDTGGAGLDTLSNFESVNGGSNSDTITGTDDANFINGGQGQNDVGDDTLIGLGGNDNLDGRRGNDTLLPGAGNDTIIGAQGNDTVSYADVGAGVTLDLDPSLTGVAQQTVGAGTDTLADSPFGPPDDPDTNHEIESITGSPFADNLTGNGLANRIVGGGGGDTIALLGGIDEFEVLDGILDSVNCGGGADSGIADEPGVDALTGCETVDHAPQTSIIGGPANGATITNRTPVYNLSANEPATFERRVDSGSFQPCAATCTIPTLSNGLHTVRFRATDSDLGHATTDQTPVTRIVTVTTPPPPPAADTDPPETTITKGPKRKTKKKRVTFEFESDEAGSSFECSLDGKGFAPCQSPATRKAKKRRKHSFEVRATDDAGNVDPTPDRHNWKRKKRRR